jgi:hypothetical protein
LVLSFTSALLFGIEGDEPEDFAFNAKLILLEAKRTAKLADHDGFLLQGLDSGFVFEGHTLKRIEGSDEEGDVTQFFSKPSSLFTFPGLLPVKSFVTTLTHGHNPFHVYCSKVLTVSVMMALKVILASTLRTLVFVPLKDFSS